MISKIKNNISLTLVEVVIAMLILSTSAAGVLGSFSYAFKFVQRAGKKIEALNYGRKAQEGFRAIWLLNTTDERLQGTSGSWVDIDNNTTSVNGGRPNLSALDPGYDGTVFYMIGPRGGNDAVDIKVDWNAP